VGFAKKNSRLYNKSKWTVFNSARLRNEDEEDEEDKDDSRYG